MEFKEYINNSLEQNILINGKSGCGKSYILKEFFKKLIKSIKTLNMYNHLNDELKNKEIKPTQIKKNKI